MKTRQVGSLLVALFSVAGCTAGVEVFELQEEECSHDVPSPELVVEARFSDEPFVLSGFCIPPGVRLDADGLADCELIERLPATGPTTSCDALPGRVFYEIQIDEAGDERQRCRLPRATATTAGWSYERAAEGASDSGVATQCGADGERITFNELTFVSFSDVEVRCAYVDGAVGNTLGTPCDESRVWGCGYLYERGFHFLNCDLDRGQCGLPCTTDHDCAAAGLTEDRCAAHGFCVPAMCPAG